MKSHLEQLAVRRVMVGTDRFEQPSRPSNGPPRSPNGTTRNSSLCRWSCRTTPLPLSSGRPSARAQPQPAMILVIYARQLAGERGHAFVVVDADPAMAIVRAAEQEAVDVTGQ